MAREPDRERPVAAQLRRVAIHHGHPHVLREGGRPAVAQPEVERRAEHQHHVRLPEREAARLGEGLRVVVRQAAATRAVGEDRHPGGLGQRAQLRGRVVPVDPAARHDHRPLGRRQQRGQLRHGSRIGRGGPPVGVAGGDRRQPVLDHRHQEIDRDLHEHRSRPAGQGVADRGGEHLGDLAGLGDRPRALGDRSQEVDLLDLLQRAEAAQAERGRAADQEHRAARGVGVGDAGHRVGDARPRGDEGDAHVPREARVGVGGVRAGLLVPHVDDLHALGETAVVDRQDVSATEREHVAHAGLPQRAGHQVSAVEVRHASLGPRGGGRPRASGDRDPRRRPRSSRGGTRGTRAASGRATPARGAA